VESRPHTTLLVVLGASEFPRSSLKPSRAFLAAADSIQDYFVNGFGLPIENSCSFFNSLHEPSALDDGIADWLEFRKRQLAVSGNPVQDLIVYYVGHGSFDEEQHYYLALQSTKDDNKSVSSLRLGQFMKRLGKDRFVRKYLIIDACFSSEATRYSQSGIQDAIGQQIKGIPEKGTAFLCSSSRNVMSEFLPDETNTRFTKALSEVLWDGRERMPARLSLQDVRDLVEDRLREDPTTFIRPEVHTPDQPEGDISIIPLFPNGPRRAEHLVAQREREAREEALRVHRQRQAKDEDARLEELAEKSRRAEAENRQRVLDQLRVEEERRKRERKQYSSEEERLFREEAEDIRDRILDEKLLHDWLSWKAEQCRISFVVLTEEVNDLKKSAGQTAYYAANIWDRLETERKSGSNDLAKTYGEEWRELDKQSRAFQQQGVFASSKAADAEIEYLFYDRKSGEKLCLSNQAGGTLFSKTSFEETLKHESAKLITQAHRRRALTQFFESCRKWTMRVLIGLVVVLVLGFCGMLNEWSKNYGP
jgi:hypothetical protein